MGGALSVRLASASKAGEVFKDSWLFPIALTAIGLGIIYLGLVWQKHEQPITRKARSWLPTVLQKFLEEKRV